MTSREVIFYASENGIKIKKDFKKGSWTLRRWMRGYYVHPKTGKKIWYFKDHTRLPFEEVSIGTGYVFSKAAVKAWVKMLLSRERSLLTTTDN